ncbi:MAG TPA: DNA-3-methyladenine glycosylase [Actinomycetota bacterium]
MTRPLPRDFYERPSLALARALLGKVVVSELGGARTVGRIVEAEAYRPDDPASHSFRGPTSGNRTMFGPPGHAYVYVSYGIHRCMNAVARSGSAVLLRALEPLHGLDAMTARRGLEQELLLCAGPGRLCQALGVTRGEDGVDLTTGEGLWITDGPAPRRVVRTPRIGISVAGDRLWRFVEEGSPYASRRATASPAAG